MSEQRVFILGNGPSLADLTPEEVAVINAHPSVAVNHFPRHQQKTGIVPKYYFLIDHNPAAQEALADMPELLRQPPLDTLDCWLSSYWFEQFTKAGYSERIHELKDFVFTGEFLNPRLMRPLLGRSTFGHNQRVLRRRLLGARQMATLRRLRQLWPQNTDDRLVWIQGTLMITLSWAFAHGYRNVHLVGVDLNDGSHFYPAQEKVLAYDTQRLKVDTRTRHGTTVWGTDQPSPPIQYMLQLVRALYAEAGAEVVIANPDSLPARLGVLPHRPVLG